MRALLAVLILGLAACYSPRTAPGDGYMGLYGGTMDAEPLHASLWIDPHTGSTSFDLNKPAHVALFIWEPGQYFHMVYPQIGFGTRQAFYEGRNHLWTSSRMGTRTRLSHRGSSFDPWRSAAGARGHLGTPTYYVLIASEEPLEVAPFYNAGASFVHRAHWGGNLYTATELLASQIVPGARDTDWTVAYQVVWPETRMQEDYRWVTCPDGTVFVVPLYALLGGAIVCPDGTRAAPPPADSVEEGGQGSEVARRMAERRAAVDAVENALSRDRADQAEVRALINRLQEARGVRDGDVDLPVPSWQRGERGVESRRVLASDSRPVIEPLPSPRTEDARARPGATRAEAWPQPGADRTRPGFEPRTRGERARTQPAPRPAETRAPPAPRRTETRPPPPPRTEQRRPPPDDAL